MVTAELATWLYKQNGQLPTLETCGEGSRRKYMWTVLCSCAAEYGCLQLAFNGAAFQQT